VSYNEKHNEANGEANNDGESHNRSWNCGAEGESDDVAINALRWQQQRNFLTTLLLSEGVPMIAHGDELGRTQHGNNNAYCQDNDLSWIGWKLTADESELLAFTTSVVSLRKEHNVFRRRRFFAGDAAHGGKSELGDIEWFSSDGTEMDEDDWRNGYARTLMVFLNGQAIPEPDPRGQRTIDTDFLLLFNAHSAPVDFTLPPTQYGTTWTIRLDTTMSAPGSAGQKDWPAATTHPVAGRSIVVLEAVPATKS
jgi:glycogen operon protein